MNRKFTKLTRKRGFTLVELLLVLVILATLAAIVIPKFAGRGEQAKKAAAQTDIRNLSLALDAFEVDNGTYPKGSDGLSELTEEPSNAQSWHGPYLSQAVKTDPWGTAYIYVSPGKNNTRGYDLSSAGPDMRAGTEDDIVNWDKSK
jgi:general secretion pathway protein G